MAGTSQDRVPVGGAAGGPQRSRTIVVVGLVVAAAGFLALALLALSPFVVGGAAPSPVWSGDGVEVFAPVWGDRLEPAGGRSWLERALGDGSSDVTFQRPTLLVRYRGTLPSGRPPAIVASCGCRFEPSEVRWDPATREGVAAFAAFPRREADLKLDLGLAEEVRAPNPRLATAPVGDPAPAIPLEVTVDGDRWVLSEDPELRSLVVRAAGPDDRPIAWAMEVATLRDAAGNLAPRAPEAEALQHVLWKPLAGAYRLCPHEPWWELNVLARPRGRETRLVTIRFRPPPPPPPAPPPR